MNNKLLVTASVFAMLCLAGTMVVGVAEAAVDCASSTSDRPGGGYDQYTFCVYDNGNACWSHDFVAADGWVYFVDGWCGDDPI